GEEKLVLESLKEVLPSCSGIVLSDYDKGFLTKGLIPEILSLSKEQKKFVAVDPQVNHFFLYKEAGILTPNHHEAGRALERKLEETEDVELGAIELANKLEAKYMMVTRGEKGMSLYERETKTFHHIPTVAREVYDVTGAGDTVISIFTAFYLAGLNALEASKVANAAAGKVIEKLGAATVSLEELEKQLVKMGVLS
ncbi:MAG: bifunctional hydroxymethylpyrimidine kinase/phosphomethylpyrimidine kinase, partial [Leptospiraceae bacterium]|nr:bifunctional hydroxymethylpyrimidine kinase/phosphomethylpyrimidine kinase [Leptospiraceae bacterium]